MNPVKKARSKILADIEKNVTRAFGLARDAAPGAETKNTIANVRKALKIAPIAPSILGTRFLNWKKPFILHHWVTLRCNCSCESCLWKDNRAEEMATDEVLKFHRECAEEGIVAMLMGGGEPLLRKDTPEIFRHAKRELGWKIGTATNGFFLEDRIEEYGDYIDATLVSIDSAKPEKHDAIRGVPGLFDRIVRGIERIKRDYPFIHVQINTCVDDNSVDELMDIVELAGELDVPISLDVITTGQNVAGEDCTDRKSHMIGSYERISEALHEALEAKRNGARIFNSENYLTSFDGGKKPYTCRYPRIFLRVMSNGDVEDCLRVGDPIGNVRTTPLKEILKSDRMRTLQKKAEKCYICSSPAMFECSNIWTRPLELLNPNSTLIG
ncbi:MAG: radical SAM protein [bacterium]